MATYRELRRAAEAREAQYWAPRRCAWCRNPDSDYEPDPETELCRLHLCEYLGMSQAAYEHMLAEQAADQL